MAVRKRSWKTKLGRAQEAWTVDYVDQAGDRHIRTFTRKKDADTFHASVNVEVGLGIHTAPSKSPTVAEAAELYLQTCRQEELERTTLDTYKQHVTLHIIPLLGTVRLSELTTPLIRNFIDRLRQSGRSPAITKKILVRLGSILAGSTGTRLSIASRWFDNDGGPTTGRANDDTLGRALSSRRRADL